MKFPELTVERMAREFEETYWGDLFIHCPDGAIAEIHPCGYGEIKSAADCDYFLIDWDIPSWGGEPTLEKLVATLNRHAELAKESEDSKAQLRAFFDRHQRDGWEQEDFDCYSDWHKDVFGFRPHGYVFGVYVNPHFIGA